MYFFCRHRYFQVQDDPSAPLPEDLRTADGMILEILNADAPILGAQPSWTPSVRDIRPVFEAAAEDQGLVLEKAEKAGSQFVAVFAPSQSAGLRVSIYTHLRADTRMDAFLEFSGTDWRTDLKALFGDMRNPTLWAPEDAQAWAQALARYADAVFAWWAKTT